MNNLKLSEEFEQKMRAAIETPAPDPVFVKGLEERLAIRAAEIKTRPRTLVAENRPSILTHRSAWAICIAAMVVIFTAAMVVGPQKVIAAVRGLIGYIPGVGFVENLEQALTLVEPVCTERDGIRLCVDKVVASLENTTISYTIQGLPPQENHPFDPTVTAGEAALVLPDGRSISMGAARLDWRGGLMEFPALPSGTDEVTLSFSHLPIVPENLVSGGWQLTFKLRPAITGEKLPSLTEIANGETPAVLPDATPIAPAYQPNLTSEKINGVTMKIDNVYQDAGQTVFQLFLELDDPGQRLFMFGPFTLKDETGKSYMLIDSTQELVDPGMRVLYRTSALDSGHQYTLSLEGLVVNRNCDAQFEFDPGLEAQDGQTWQVNREMEVDGHQFKITTAALTQHDEEAASIDFTIVPITPGLASVMIANTDVTGGGGGGGGGGWPFVTESLTVGAGVNYPLKGPLHFRIFEIAYAINGPWQIIWQPPDVSSGVVLPAPTSSARSYAPPYEKLPPELLALVEESKQGALKNGWLHETFVTIQRDTETFEYHFDYWHHLDQNGKIDLAIQMVKNPDGSLVSQSIYKNGYTSDVISGLAYPSDPPLTRLESLRDGLAGDTQAGYTVRQEQITLDGKPVMLITAERVFDSPSRAVDGSLLTLLREQTWVDIETGNIIKSKSESLTTSGEVREELSEESLSIEFVDAPPAEILDQIEKVITP